MRIRLVFVGGGARGEAGRLLEDYVRRIRRRCRIEVVAPRAATGRAVRGASRAEREGRAALAAAGEKSTVVALDAGGARMTSEEFARWLGKALAAGSTVSFVVGGAEGLSAEICRRADRRLSLSTLTLPHELAQVLLCEQIYRAFSILEGAPYHR
jgi:23S rRNA (pseudouridine1915-N3)-methyltransferase